MSNKKNKTWPGFIGSMTALVLILACNHSRNPVSPQQHKNTEAREDSIEMAEALALQAQFGNRLCADGETQPVNSLPEEDAADDPAIWFNSEDPGRSLIIGTNKKAGLQVFDLEGNTLQVINSGKINNVDLRDGFIYGNRPVTLVAGSNRSNNCITLFYLDPVTMQVSDSIFNIPSRVDTVYGICLYKDIDESRFYVFANGKGGQIAQWEIIPDGKLIQTKWIRSFHVGSQPEGMVADDKHDLLYLGIEEEGIVKINALPDKDAQLNKIAGSDTLNQNIEYDIEGLALLELGQKTYLVASIQGNFSFAIFELGNKERYVTSFVIEPGQYDGVEETDGLEIFSNPIMPKYPDGLMVAQDGFNHDGDTLKSQNFKMISLKKIIDFIVTEKSALQ